MYYKIDSLGTIHGVTKVMVDKVQALVRNFEEGRYEFEGGAYLNAETYRTKESSEKDFEAHRLFVDVQIVVSGQEIIETSSVCSIHFKETVPYSKEKDIIFMNGDVAMDTQQLYAGDVCVLYPMDAHKPGINLEGEHEVRKIVIKLPLVP